MNPITVVTLGTGDQQTLTLGALDALTAAKAVVLRTARHPLAAYLKDKGVRFDSFDELYEQCDDFDAFNSAVTDKLLAMAKAEPVCYAVSDAAFDTTVIALANRGGRQVRVLPGVSHASRCLALVKRDSAAVRAFAAVEFLSARVTPAEPLLLCELHSRECAGDCKLKLAALMPEEMTVTFISGDEQTGQLKAKQIKLLELDRQKAYDHLSAAYIPAVPMEERKRFDMDDLLYIMKRLRAPDGCPWDREQTHESLLTNLLEESYEYIQAVRDGDTEHMYDELGDVLLQIVFHAEIARQHGDFDFLDVATAISQKMQERHPHIFGTVKADTAAQVLDNWEAIKRSQRGIRSHAQAMKDVSTGLSPMMRAGKVQQKAAKVGFDFSSAVDALKKVHEEADEVGQNLADGADPEEELGDLMFSVENVCRLCGINPDIALYSAVNKFISRFEKMEMQIKMSGKCIEDLTLSEMDVYWDTGKRDE